MASFETHLLCYLIFFPLAWGVLGLLIPGERGGGFGKAARYWALIGTLFTFAISLLLFVRYNPGGDEFQLLEKVEWIPAFGASYHVGIDGLSLWLILLTTFLSPIVVLASFEAIETRSKEYYFLLLALETGMLGAFVALDLFLFYLFWEAMLIPMYFLIGIWGGKDRIYAATKFFLFTLVGSLLMLVAVFYLGNQHQLQFGAYSMNVLDLYNLKLDGGSFVSPQTLLFLAFALAFAVKVPLFPFHTWLPDAHVQAPTAGSVILAGVLLKFGGYGFLRFAMPLLPMGVEFFRIPILILSTIAIVYGALVAWVQPDIKKLVAYSSVSHMGYVMLGLFALNSIGVTGAAFQMLNHGISTGGLFLLVGMLYERRHTRELSEFGGFAKVMPIFSVVLMIMTLSSVALPVTNGFVGEFLILLGAWQAQPQLAVIAGTGVVLGAIYMLWLVQKMIFGPIRKPENQALLDLTGREMALLLPLVVAVFALGIYPIFILDSMQPSLQRILARSDTQMTAVASYQRDSGEGSLISASTLAEEYR